MRRMFWLVLVLAGCAGADSNPVRVAERFHTLRVSGDDRGIHALLTDADRAAIPVEAFPDALPARLALELLSWTNTRLDSASLLGIESDTAAVVLHVSNGAPDTLRLLARHAPLRLWRFERDRVRWRVSMALAERAVLDSLATAVRTDIGGRRPATVEHARAYLRIAERNPAVARPADLEAARSLVRRATVAEALRVDVRVAESFTGALYVAGEVENPTRSRVATLRLIVRDAAGAEQQVELWDIAPGETAPIWQMTKLRKGELTHRLEPVQVF